MSDKVKVSQRTLDAIDTVRETGMTNMFDTRVVKHILDLMGYTDVSAWISNNKEDYANGILKGFEVE